MSEQEQQSAETTAINSKSHETALENENQLTKATEQATKNEHKTDDQRPVRRVTMPQDVRYSTEQDDRDKLMQKYSHYQISDTDACNVRFLTDNRQKRNLLGRNDEEDSNLQSIGKTFDVDIFPGYQHVAKHSYKIFGTEANVRKCLIETMNRMFQRPNRRTQRDQKASDGHHASSANEDSQQTKDTPVENETSHPASIFVTTINPDSSVTEEKLPITPNVPECEETSTSTDKPDDDQSSHPTSIFVTTINPDSSVTQEEKLITPDVEKTEESKASTEIENLDEQSSGHPTSIFVTTINPDSSVTQEEKPIAATTPNTNEEKTDGNNEQETLKFTPLERKPQHTFVMLISSQGQEVLKKNWSFFAGSLQQRLNVVVANPVKLPKFGDKHVQNELTITGELVENLTDACLQITAFINDVLGVPSQPYKSGEGLVSDDHNHHQRSKHDNHRAVYSPNSNQSSSFNNQHGRTSFNRTRGGMFEQVILIRSDCVARIVGTRGSNLKRIQTKCHLRDIFIARQANENGYVEGTLAAYQPRSLYFAINTIRGFLRNEDDTAVIVVESNHADSSVQDSPHFHELAPPNSEHLSTTSSELHRTNDETSFRVKSLNVSHGSQYPQPSYNFQNTPSFDFTHQATSAARKTDKRRGDLTDHNKTPSESQNLSYEPFSSSTNYLSNSPRHKSKRSCPETKEIDCTTDEGFWIQKQYYHALDDTSKQLFDSLIEKLDKIRLETEENAARKQQRLVGRNRANKTRGYTSSIPYLNENNTEHEKDLTIKSTEVKDTTKVNPTNDVIEEKENKQETSSVMVNQN